MIERVKRIRQAMEMSPRLVGLALDIPPSHYCDMEAGKRDMTPHLETLAELFDADDLIAALEARGLGWSLDHTGNVIEARIWDWPTVVGRYRPGKVEPLGKMLFKAMLEFDLPEKEWEGGK